jgi:signal transduction histidine kinase
LSSLESRVLVEEHAALRRVATLVARGVPPEELFAAVTEEVGRLLPVEFAIMGRYEADETVTCVAAWGAPTDRFPVGGRSRLEGKNLVTIVRETRRPTRVDQFEHATGPIGVAGRESGFHSAVGTPIVVEGHVWGVMTVGSTHLQPQLPMGIEARLAQFTELLATAVANAESHAGLTRLAEEQAALRRVATLVARRVPAQELFKAFTQEVGRVLSAQYVHLIRYEPDGTATALVAFGPPDDVLPAGARLTLGGENVTTLVLETGRSARIDDHGDASGPSAAGTSDHHVRSSVATPIVVEASLWGVMVVGCSEDQSLPADTEARLGSFTELLATAIANTESRAALAQLAQEQEALRRVATLVAQGVAPEQVFASVTAEVERLLLCDVANLARFESDGTFTIVASTRERFPVGSRLPMGGENVATILFETGRPCRLENITATGPLADHIREAGVHSAVGTPILVEDHLWGGLSVGSTREALPPDTEARLAAFTDLVAMAIANAQSRAALRPVERMRSQAEQITERELSARLPVSDDTGEVTALGRTLNAMLDRVEEAVARERRVVSDASHELRTPLTTLRAEVDLALMGDRDNAELRAALMSASEEAKRMSRLADDLLVLARADQGRLPLHPQPLTARELLEDAAGRARAGAEVRGRSIAIAELSDDCVVHADPDRAAQALDNLITNALLYGEGTITLSARSGGEDVELHVSDEGHGFPEDLLPRAFERFGRGQHARSNEPGSGLGLALVEAVAVAHHGHAEARNRPHGGADVSITLPCA